jgi:hypothetical protein
MCVVFCSAIGMTEVTAKDLCLGTFSSLHFNADSGDLSGTEIRLIGTRNAKQASVQFSDGEPGPLIATPVICNGTHLSFSLPKDVGRVAATFDGVVSSTRLIGEFVFETGARDKVVLMRRKSYWDKTY